MSGLDHVLETLVQACTPTTDDFNKRLALIERIQRVLDKCFGYIENLRVIPYGSFVSQFYNVTSDLDLAICGTYPLQKLKPASRAEIFRGGSDEKDVSLHKLDRRTKAQLLRDVGTRLLAAGLARQGALEFILHARVPIVKFVEPVSGIEVDLCLGSDATAFKAWSVAQVASIHPAFGKLFRVVKVWAKAHSINDGAAHMFNSWCLTLVVIAFLQTYPDPPLLPPLHELLYDSVPDLSQPRLLQGGRELPAEVYEIMGLRTRKAQEVYGSRACKPVEQLFRDFVEDGGRKLRSLLAREDSFLRDTRVSAFYGKMLNRRPFAASYVLCVEDPFDDTDNTARTLGTWEGHPGTIHYITSVFERTLRHLDRHIGAASRGSGSTQGEPSAAAAAAAVSAALAGRRSSDLHSDCGASDCGTSTSSASASSASGRSASSRPQPSSSPSGSLASTCVFLFGTELLTRLPQLSERLLGPGLVGWARGALAGGRPAGEVHQELLARLGVEQEFVSFESFKRRYGIKVHNEAKYSTPEEKAAIAAQEAARRTAKKAREAEKRAAKKARDATQQARTTAREGLEAAAYASGAREAGEDAATVAATAALGGKQATKAPRERSAATSATKRRPRISAPGGSSDEHAVGTGPLLPPPPAPQRHASNPSQQKQLRVRLAPEGRALLEKAMAPQAKPGEGVAPGPSSSEMPGPGSICVPRRQFSRSSGDGAAAAMAAMSVALREAPTDVVSEVAPKETSKTSEVVSTSGCSGGSVMGLEAAAAGAAVVAGADTRQRRWAWRQSYEGPGEGPRQAEGAAAGRSAASSSLDASAVEHAMQGLTLGCRTAKGKGSKAQQLQQLWDGGRGGGSAPSPGVYASSGEATAAAAAAAAVEATAPERRHSQRQHSSAAAGDLQALRQQPVPRPPRSTSRRVVMDARDGGAADAGPDGGGAGMSS